MTVTRATGFRHEALLYGCSDEFLRATADFARDAVASGHPLLAVLHTAKIRWLRETLQDDADHIEFVDMTTAGHNPARLIPIWDRFVADHDSGRPLRGIGEPVWPGRGPDELVECHHHEALLNLAFADAADFTLLCPYDTSALPPDVIATAAATHPYVNRSGRRDSSPGYRGTDPGYLLTEPLDPPPARCSSLRFDTVRTVRPFVSRQAAEAGAGPDRVADIVLAVNEVAANSLLYGGGSGSVSMWCEDGTLLCEVRDRGCITDPLVGRRPPDAEQQNGRGLWVVNHLCDVVQIRSSPEGTTTRLHFRSIGSAGDLPQG